MAMRLALIVAISIDHAATVIATEATSWAIAYIKFSTDQTVDMLKTKVSGSEHESDKKKTLEAIRNTGATGVSWKEMQNQPPFSEFKKRDLNDILQSLVDAESIALQDLHSDKPGRPRRAYVAVAID